VLLVLLPLLLLLLLVLLLLLQVDVRVLTQAFCKQCFGRVLAVNEVRRPGPRDVGWKGGGCGGAALFEPAQVLHDKLNLLVPQMSVCFSATRSTVTAGNPFCRVTLCNS